MKTYFTVIGCVLLFHLGYSNNIQVSNVVLTDQDKDNDFTYVQFDLSWENSWRTNVAPSNWDAAWVFVKYKKNGGITEHATLNYVDGTGTGDGHTVPAGAVIKTQSDNVGCFIYRSANGTGTATFNGIKLRWNYGVDGLQDNDVVEVKVFAIEMVYIPEGSFYLGAIAGGPEVDNFYSPIPRGQTYYQVNSEGEITVANTTGALYYNVSSGGNYDDQSGPIPATFPKGYNDFYIMKYEVSEEQWIDFFNSLSAVQKTIHDITDVDHKNSDDIEFRNTIAWTEGGNATTSAPGRAVHYINWNNMAAYLDWTGLRPMTELEFEKACRGPNVPFSGEYAWGTDLINFTNYNITNDGTENALISNPGTGVGNCNLGFVFASGPMRVGIFAASAITKDRQETGASYYGVMEMSGNVFEQCISVGNATERGYTGAHGDGEIEESGLADVSAWIIPTAWRGGGNIGSIGVTLNIYMTGDRSYSSNTPINPTDNNGRFFGIRGVRTAE